jgi:Zn-dependent protease
MFEAADEEAVERDLEPIREQLARLAEPKANWAQAMLVLVVSLVVFGVAGRYGEGAHWTFLGALVVVVFVHEMGHVAAMWVFDYQDLRIFFVPFFGAAASGRKRKATGVQRAIVSLAGPLPGIVIGIGLGLLWTRSHAATLGMFAALFLSLNILNLLPVVPLDGGRFFDAILFSRWPAFQLLVNLATGALLVVLGFGIDDWILMGLGAFLVLGARVGFKVARLGVRLREELPQEERAKEQIPGPLVGPLAERVSEEIGLSSTAKPRVLASLMDSAWQAVHNEPPRLLATFGLVAIYGIGLVGPPVAAIVATITGYEEILAADGQRKITRLWGFELTDAELDRAGGFHGAYREYAFLTEKPSIVGRFDDGFRSGSWQLLGPDGAPIAEADYSAGVFQTGRVRRDGIWSECSFEALPVELQDSLEIRQERPARVSGLERREP